MRILYFSRDYTTHDRRFLLKLAESRHEVWFLRLEDDGIPYEKRPLPTGIRPVEWEGGGKRFNSVETLFALMPSFETVLDQVRPDLVHAGPVQSCGLMTALVGFRPFLLMSWGSDVLVDADQSPIARWTTVYTLKRSDMLLCDSQAVRAKVQRLTNYPDQQIVQFPWGIDLTEFAPRPGISRIRSDMGLADSYVVLSTRSWEEIYGIDIVLDAFSLAYQRNSSLRLVLLGYGSLSSKVERHVSEHGLGHVVYRPGMVPHYQLPDYFRMADAYISCTYSDGSSISLLEAMATGLPVIVTDGPGNREWVVPDENGWLVPAGQREVFAERIIQAANLGISERLRIHERNRQVTEERANWKVNFPKLLKAYDQIEFTYYSAK